MIQNLVTNALRGVGDSLTVRNLTSEALRGLVGKAGFDLPEMLSAALVTKVKELAANQEQTLTKFVEDGGLVQILGALTGVDVSGDKVWRCAHCRELNYYLKEEEET